MELCKEATPRYYELSGSVSVFWLVCFKCVRFIFLNFLKVTWSGIEEGNLFL